MRAAIYAVLGSLCLAASPSWARNGETGILVTVDGFEWVADSQQNNTVMLCNNDVEKIATLLMEVGEASLYLPGYGSYKVGFSAEDPFVVVIPKDCL